jgi:glutamate racemase
VVYRYTLQAVHQFFEMGAHLVVLACNTASAKALRSIQQRDLPHLDPDRRVLGVVRPSVEEIGHVSRNGHVGVLGTNGTVLSLSYPLEIKKLFPEVLVTQQACPMWVPLVENGELNSPGAAFFVEKDLAQLFHNDPQIDTLILGCTHYPLLLPLIQSFVPKEVTILSQGDVVASSLRNYLDRHPGMDQKCSKGGRCQFFTTEDPERFDQAAQLFLQQEVKSMHLEVEK